MGFLLSGMHGHGGEETLTLSDALNYRLPMHGLFLFLVVVFSFVERWTSQANS